MLRLGGSGPDTRRASGGNVSLSGGRPKRGTDSTS
jgi:hypothetical protein